MRTLSFVKLSGAGNDFIFLSERDFPSEGRSALAKKLCQRRLGIGADGLVFIKENSPQSFSWDFYNSDGSKGEMCGNAARCAGRYVQLHLRGSDKFTLETLVGAVEVEVESDERVTVTMPPSQWVLRESQRAIINTGVPHLVLERKINKESLLLEAPGLRFPGELDDKGANVTFVEKKEGGVSALTFERGVEGFTLACGTGAMAAAVYAQEFLGLESGEIKVDMPGGELVVVTQKERPLLSGPAEQVFVGEVKV